jgi:hypothetical protein
MRQHAGASLSHRRAPIHSLSQLPHFATQAAVRSLATADPDEDVRFYAANAIWEVGEKWVLMAEKRHD